MKMNEETGAWLAGIGFLVGLFGVMLAFTVFPLAGYWIALSGAVLGFAGIFIHFMKNWREIFHIHHE